MYAYALLFSKLSNYSFANFSKKSELSFDIALKAAFSFSFNGLGSRNILHLKN